MKAYNFEYTRQDIGYLLFVLSFAIIGLGILLFKNLFNDLLPAGFVIISLIAAGVTFFLLNRHRIKRTGIAKLSMSDLTIELNQSLYINFADLKYYYIYDGKNGPAFTLGFINGSKFKIAANNNFCNVDLIMVFLTDFRSAIENYNAQNNANIIRLESIWARKYAPHILSVFTVLIILGFCFTRMPVLILPISFSASLLVGWIRYFQLKSKNKLVDF
ncbi:hypothetical protein SAMN05216464_104176 [Mucilaginibacter pineti]|uniref:Uncharacterized protein n=1 Tax=Mucilaginibacter pineti TaxID=1391627 RepID=A0A1G7AM79_9SPHI|nr:hypothetical protein SAMN05216464_104176 [Mucilaginibacter pineti]